MGLLKWKVRAQKEHIIEREGDLKRAKGRFWKTKHFLDDLVDILCGDEDSSFLPYTRELDRKLLCLQFLWSVYLLSILAYIGDTTPIEADRYKDLHFALIKFDKNCVSKKGLSLSPTGKVDVRYARHDVLKELIGNLIFRKVTMRPKANAPFRLSLHRAPT